MIAQSHCTKSQNEGSSCWLQNHCIVTRRASDWCIIIKWASSFLPRKDKNKNDTVLLTVSGWCSHRSQVMMDDLQKPIIWINLPKCWKWQWKSQQERFLSKWPVQQNLVYSPHSLAALGFIQIFLKHKLVCIIFFPIIFTSHHQFRRTSQKINILDEILCVSLYPSNFIICFYGKKGPNLSKISIFWIHKISYDNLK